MKLKEYKEGSKPNPNKPFWLFTYMLYYPEGGMNDFLGSFDTLEEAKAEAMNTDKNWAVDYWHVIDIRTGDTFLSR